MRLRMVGEMVRYLEERARMFTQNNQAQGTPHSQFINVNILDNFLRFYETGIPELADIVT